MTRITNLIARVPAAISATTHHMDQQKEHQMSDEETPAIAARRAEINREMAADRLRDILAHEAAERARIARDAEKQGR